MLKCFGRAASFKLFDLRTKFNGILEDRILDGNKDNHYVMSIEVNPNDFDCTGYLTKDGKNTFWREVLKAFMKFDTNQISLRPRKYKASLTAVHPAP